MYFLSNDELIERLISDGIVGSENNKFYFTEKGALFQKTPSLSFDDVIIVPKKNKLSSRSHVCLESRISKNYVIPTPLVCSNMECVINSDYAIELWKYGIASVMHRFYSSDEEYIEEVKKVCDAGVLGIVSCGIQKTYIELMKKLVNVGAKIIVIDVAHGHSDSVKELCIELKKSLPDYVDIIVGSIATAEAVDFLAPYVDGFRAGIGNGAVCQTQVKTGAGLGQITTVLDVSEAAQKYNIPVMSDGSIKESGDAVKAIVAGASTVMMGKLFAICKESAGEIIQEENKTYKLYYGMASNVLKNKIYGDSKKHVASEGIAVKIPIGKSISEFAPEFLAAMKSGYTYCGAETTEEVTINGELRISTENSYIHGIPHASFDDNAEKVSD